MRDGLAEGLLTYGAVEPVVFGLLDEPLHAGVVRLHLGLRRVNAALQVVQQVALRHGAHGNETAVDEMHSTLERVARWAGGGVGGGGESRGGPRL